MPGAPTDAIVVTKNPLLASTIQPIPTSSRSWLSPSSTRLSEVREHGLQEIHSFPLVSRGKGFPVSRKPARLAWRWPEIELRTPNSIPVLILDVDTSPIGLPERGAGPQRPVA